ncbi:chemotaxis protein CheW [Thermodesulfobacteriota bacterium]
MSQIAKQISRDDPIELITFFVGEALCGLDIKEVRGINKIQEITPVYLSPEYVTGLINLRGFIVTIIDLGIKLGLSSSTAAAGKHAIIVSSGQEYVGLLVDRLNDVIHSDFDNVEKTPANIGGLQGKFFDRVVKDEKQLIGVLDVREILKI